MQYGRRTAILSAEKERLGPAIVPIEIDLGNVPELIEAAVADAVASTPP